MLKSLTHQNPTQMTNTANVRRLSGDILCVFVLDLGTLNLFRLMMCLFLIIQHYPIHTRSRSSDDNGHTHNTTMIHYRMVVFSPKSPYNVGLLLHKHYYY